MIDLETLDILPTAKIVSIGAVIFDPRYNAMGGEFYEELDFKAQTNRTSSADTIAWWKKQSVEARKSLKGTADLKATLEALATFLPYKCRVWGNGPTFDIVILEDAYRSFNMQIPWDFWNIRDMRTIKDIYENERGGFGWSNKTVAHNALLDAIDQAKNVNKYWKIIMEIPKRR